MALPTLDMFRGHLHVDKNRLDDELEMHSDLAERLSSEVARREGLVAEFANAVKLIEAEVMLEARRSGEKMIVEEMKAFVILNPRRRRAQEDLMLEEVDLAKWKGMQAAWRDKLSVMKKLSELYVGNYFDVVSSTRGGKRDYEAGGRDADRQAIRDATETVSRRRTDADEEQPVRRRAMD